MVSSIYKVKKVDKSTRKECPLMKNILVKNVNQMLISLRECKLLLVNPYNIRKYMNKKEYEITNRNISNFS